MGKVLAIAGMHRSGTSLTAMWLHSCGLNIGKDLMTGQFDNPRGHFEDLEVLKIHECDLQCKGLRSHGLNLKGKEDFLFEEETKELANKYVKNKLNLDQWGWKEPRSTLYLNSWKKLIPELKVIAIYRSCQGVTDSLLRRVKHSFFHTNKYKPSNRYSHIAIFPLYLQLEKRRFTNAWIAYNRSIIEFKNRYPNDIIIVNLENLIRQNEFIFSKLVEKFSLDLKYFQIDKVFDSNMLHQTDKRAIIRPEVLKMEDILKNIKDF